MTIKTLTVAASSLAGGALTTAALGATDTAFDFVNDGSVVLFVENASAGTIVATANAGSVDGLAITDPTVSIGAGVTKFFGPFDPKYFNAAGKCSVAIDVPGTSIKAQAIKLP